MYWGDFQAAQTFFCSIPNPGFSTKVRYNENKDTIYVRIFPKVDDAFILNTPHVFSEEYEIALGKWFGQWMIYQLGGHLDSIYEDKKVMDNSKSITGLFINRLIFRGGEGKHVYTFSETC